MSQVAFSIALAATSGVAQRNGRCGPENTGPEIGWLTTASDAC